MGIAATRDAARREQRPSSESRGLPNHFFTDPEHYRLEQQSLFHRTWVFAGITAAVPAPGSVFHTEVAGVPIVFTHDDDGKIRAFQNVCLHRGARLVCANKTRAKRLTCPYHAWAYRLDGKLASGPITTVRPAASNAPAMVRRRACLRFAWLSGTGPCWSTSTVRHHPSSKYLESLNRETAPYDFAPVRYAQTITAEFESNWKLSVENWMDSYHVFSVHPTLDKMMIPEQRKAAIDSGTLIYTDYFLTEIGLEKRGGGLPRLPGVPEELSNASFNALQFPNWSISVHPSYLMFWHFVALAVDRTRVELHMHFVGDAADDGVHAETRAQLLDYYTLLNEEDRKVCRLLQEGRAAPAYDGGRFSPYWDAGGARLAELVRRAME